MRAAGWDRQPEEDWADDLRTARRATLLRQYHSCFVSLPYRAIIKMFHIKILR